MRGFMPPHPQYAFMARCLVKHGDNFAFAFTTQYFFLLRLTL